MAVKNLVYRPLLMLDFYIFVIPFRACQACDFFVLIFYLSYQPMTLSIYSHWYRSLTVHWNAAQSEKQNNHVPKQQKGFCFVLQIGNVTILAVYAIIAHKLYFKSRKKNFV